MRELMRHAPCHVMSCLINLITWISNFKQEIKSNLPGPLGLDWCHTLCPIIYPGLIRHKKRKKKVVLGPGRTDETTETRKLHMLLSVQGVRSGTQVRPPGTRTWAYLAYLARQPRPLRTRKKPGFGPKPGFFRVLKPGFDPGFSETGFCPRHENRVFSRFCSKTGFWAPKPGFERNREKTRFLSRFKTGFRFPVRVLGFFPVLPQNRVLGPKTGF